MDLNLRQCNFYSDIAQYTMISHEIGMVINYFMSNLYNATLPYIVEFKQNERDYNNNDENRKKKKNNNCATKTNRSTIQAHLADEANY